VPEPRYREASPQDLGLLAEWNHQMIADQRHDNPMTVAQLRTRMSDWVGGEYKVGLFERDGKPSAYVVWRLQDDVIFLRQLFVARTHRRQGLGRTAMEILFRDVWPRYLGMERVPT
jgi:GNAT superfamily N-acetyltransferase